MVNIQKKNTFEPAWTPQVFAKPTLTLTVIMLQMQLIQLVQIQFFSFLFTAHLKSFFSPDTFIYSLNPQISEYFQRYVTEFKIFNVVSDCIFFFCPAVS